MQWSFDKKFTVVLTLALATVILLGFIQYLSVRRFAADSKWVSQTHDVLRELVSLRNRLNRADASAQRYAITRDPVDLATYQRARSLIQDSLQKLATLTSDNTSQQQRVLNLQAPTRRSMDALQQEVGLPGDGTSGAAQLQTLENSVRDANTATRAIITQLETEELELLEKRNADTEHSNRFLNLLLIGGTLTAFLLLGTAGQIIRVNMQRRMKLEEASRQGEERFRLMVEGVQDYAIIMLDRLGHIESWNTGAQRIKGYEASEILGKHFSCFYTGEDVSSGKPQQFLDAATLGHAEQEGWRVRADGSRFFASVVITARLDSSGNLVGFSKVTRDITERMKAQQALRQEIAEKTEMQQKVVESEESLRRLSVTLLRTQDEERQRIGREVHDSLGQYLAVLKMKLDGLAASPADAYSDGAIELKQCSDLLTQCITEVRTISYLLYPPLLEEMGLKSAVPWYLDGFSQRSGITTTFDVPTQFDRLERDVELTLFRILQEALTNVHRHSGSPTAAVRLVRTSSEIVLEVIDHGTGISAEVLEQSGPGWVRSLGVGLRGMNERLRQLGGNLDIESSEQGTTVRATIPGAPGMSGSKHKGGEGAELRF